MTRPPTYRLPPFRVERTYRALAETIDWGLAAYGVPEVWKQTRGRGIRVAVLDTGIDDAHPDLTETTLAARDFTGSSSGLKDRVGHGTHVAGIIAARQNGVGVVGLCPELKADGGGLLVAKVLGDDGAGSDAAVTAGLLWAIEQQAHVISLSLGSPQDSPAMHRAIRRAADRGMFVICAAGNNGRDDSVDYPARYAETVAVAAVDRHGRVATFSSRGPQVDIAAPGQDVLSTYLEGGYAKLSGTSMAAPFVTGVVALVLSKHHSQGGQTPVADTEQLLAHLARTARDAGSPGKDPAYGFGLIDPASLVGPPQPTDLPAWAGLRLELQVAGAPAVAVLAPRDAQVIVQ
jgi:subtilisin family serine protease